MQRFFPPRGHFPNTSDEKMQMAPWLGPHCCGPDSSGLILFHTYPDSLGIFQALVVADLFIDGLPLFNYDEVYTFRAGILDSARLYPGIPASHDTTGHQTLSFLRSAFLKHISGTPNAYANTCLSATLGYIDVTWLPENVLSWGTPIKVWRITPSNSDFPEVFVKDDDGAGWTPLSVHV